MAERSTTEIEVPTETEEVTKEDSIAGSEGLLVPLKPAALSMREKIAEFLARPVWYLIGKIIPDFTERD